MFLSNPFPGAFGLNINDLSITLVQLKKQVAFLKPPTFSISASRTTTLPPGCIVNGEIEQPEVVRRKILHLLGSDGTHKPIKSPWVVANLPEPKTFVKLIQIDGSTKDLLPDDILYHAAKHLPFVVEEAYLDWQIITPGENSTELLLSAVSKTTADSYTYLLEAAGLNPLALELEAQAIARVMITEDKEYINEARALFDIGETRSSLIIYDKNTIQFTASIQFSTEIVTTALSVGLKIPHDEAAKLLNVQGLQYNKQQPKYISIVNGQLEKLATELKQAFCFYRDHFTKSNPITHITMSGSLADLPNLATVLSQKIKISARPGNAWKNFSKATVTASQTAQGLTLTTALGLALRAAKNPLQQES